MKIWNVLFIVMLGIYFSGCASKTHISNKHTKLAKQRTYNGHSNTIRTRRVKAPEYFDVRVGIKNWLLVPGQFKILDGMEETLGRVRIDKRGIYLDNVVVKLIATNFPEDYWLVQLPNFKEGIFTLRAIRRRDPFHMTELKNNPPRHLNLVIVRKNKKVVDNYFENKRPWWGTFDMTKIDTKNKILYFKNSQYPNYEWHCKYPTKDGKYLLDVRLIEEE